MHIFISYARIDEGFARQLASALSQMDADVWLDVDDIPAGMNWSSAIQHGLDNCDLMLVIISPESMASSNVENEWQWFLDERKPIIPILWRESRSHFQLRRLQYINFKDQAFNKAFQQLQGEIARVVGVPNEDVSPPPPVDFPTPQTTSPTDDISDAPAELARAGRVSRLTRNITLGLIGLLLVAVVALAIFKRFNDESFSSAENQTALAGVGTTMADLVTVGSVLQTATSAAATQVNEEQLATNQAYFAATNVVATQLKQAEAATNEANTAATDVIKTQIAARIPTNTPLPVPTLPDVVTSNAEWTPVYQTFDDVEMLLVPPGCFMMGSNDSEEGAAPAHEQCFEQPFWIDRYEVTNIQVGNTATFEGDYRPRDSVTWFEARDWCAARYGRLPTEREWEYAARGPDTLIYPWGNAFVEGSSVHASNANEQSAVVGSLPVGNSWVGASDMSGNLWEWVSSLEWAYPYASDDGREDLTNQEGDRTLRGGSWSRTSDELTTFYRDRNHADQTSSEYGFRCVRDYDTTATINAMEPGEHNTDWLGGFQTFDGFEMAFVPAGCFMMGNENGSDDEKPVELQCLDQPFWIDRYEVTNQQYGSEGYFEGDNRPRDSVSWFEARDFCAARDARLPTEREWEYAARGPDNWLYPWGNDLIADYAVFDGNSGGESAVVGSRPAGQSWVGAFDMSGNLAEWTSSLYRDYPYQADDGREDFENVTEPRVLRGGTFSRDAVYLVVTVRSKNEEPGTQIYDFGFRCVRDHKSVAVSEVTESVTQNADWQPIYETFDGVEMALVPTGCFMMGSDKGSGDQAPAHEQCFDQLFWIDRYEVTNDQYGSEAFFEGDNHPRDSVTWFEARDFCAARNARLPTEREWEYAARGPDNLIYPWGNDLLDEPAVHTSNSNEESADVGSLPAGNSWVGASDMSGNLWEWVSSLYWPYPYAEDDGREEPEASEARMIRGGSWGLDSSVLSAAYRGGGADPTEVNNEYGFRCARDY